MLLAPITMRLGVKMSFQIEIKKAEKSKARFIPDMPQVLSTCIAEDDLHFGNSFRKTPLPEGAMQRCIKEIRQKEMCV